MNNLRPGNLFEEPPTIKFFPEKKFCPKCDGVLKVKKTETSKTAYTLAFGPVTIHETILHCNECDNDEVYRSENLRKLIPFRCRYGYDVLVFAGTRMFLHSWDIARIKNDLAAKGVVISSSEISYLGKKFIVYLTQIHRESRERIKGHMHLNGGYILHIDGTMEADSPVLMSVLDGITGLVLDNIKIPSERSRDLGPFLRGVKNDYGRPLALVHDMGSGILKTVKEVFPGAPDFICHFHFLRDLGRDLMDKEYDIIRKRLKKHGIQSFLNTVASSLKEAVENNTAVVSDIREKMNEKQKGGIMPSGTASISAFILVKWIINGKRQGQGYGYPFDRPLLNLYQRLRMAYSASDKLRCSRFKGGGKEKRIFGKLWRKFSEVINDKKLNNAVKMMEKKAEVFDKLRAAMQITDPNGKDGLNDAGNNGSPLIEKSVKAFSNWLDNSGIIECEKDYRKMNDQIKKYWEKLFSDPIIVDTKQGVISIQPQRTNNILERFFRDLRRMYRKKTGFDSLTKTLKSMIADTPLVKNLENKEYMKIILNGKMSLEERFAEVDPLTVKAQMAEAQKKIRKMPPGIGEILKTKNLAEKLVDVVQSYE